MKKIRPEIYAKKLGMTHFISEEGEAIPVTAVELAENIVTEVKTEDKHGYSAVQFGANTKKDKHLNKPKLGNLKKKDLPNLSMLKEFKIKPEEAEQFKVGEKIDISKIIVPNQKVDVTGKSIGKGFQGMVKLHNIARGRKSHGSKSYRQPGSIGAGTYPGRVFPGKDMPSRMGNEQITTKNLLVVDYIEEENLVLIKGSVPGVEGSFITIKPALCKKKVAVAEKKPAKK